MLLEAYAKSFPNLEHLHLCCILHSVARKPAVAEISRGAKASKDFFRIRKRIMKSATHAVNCVSDALYLAPLESLSFTWGRGICAYREPHVWHLTDNQRSSTFEYRPSSESLDADPVLTDEEGVGF